MTGDLDALQLVCPTTAVLTNQKGVSDIKTYTPLAVRERYGLDPSHIIDLKALKGDASDNIPGVTGIGEKTAVTLLQKWGSLDGIYAHLEEINPAHVRQKLADGRDMAMLSRELATIDCHVPVPVTLEELLFAPDWPRLLSAFEKYRFTTLSRLYQKQMPTPVAHVEKNISDLPVRVITDVADLRSYEPQLRAGFTIDLETTSLSVLDAQIVGIALAFSETNSIYLPFSVSSDTSLLALMENVRDTGNNASPILTTLKPFLEDPAIPKVTHHGKFDCLVLQNYDVTLRGLQFDTLLAHYLLYPGEPMDLKSAVERHLGVAMTTFRELVGKKGRITDVTVEQAAQYAAADVIYTTQLRAFLEPQLGVQQLTRLFHDMEMPLQLVLAKMEKTGVRLDTTYMATLESDFSVELSKVAADIYRLTGEVFNLNSTQQLGQILFQKLGLPTVRKTKTGFSTDSSVLEELRDQHPVAELLLRYRTLEKLMNTYVRVLPQLIHPRTGRIHTSFNQTVAVTGRLSSTNPNLQNIPIRTTEGSKIRRAFIADPGYKIMSADYSQIEIRILAHLSGDAHLEAAFRNQEDIHKNTAARIFQKPVDAVTKEERYRAKTVNFGIIYGQSAFGLSKQLGISAKEAKGIINSYYDQFPTIRRFMDATLAFAREHGFVKTELGRNRPIPDIKSSNPARRGFAERTAINTRVQGTAADIIKLAMIAIQRRLEAENFKSRMLIQVHDELVFEAAESEIDRLTQLIRQEMMGAVSLGVPLEVDIAVGDNWQETS